MSDAKTTTAAKAKAKTVRVVQTDNGMFACLLIAVVLTMCTTIRISTYTTAFTGAEVSEDVFNSVTLNSKHRFAKLTKKKAPPGSIASRTEGAMSKPSNPKDPPVARTTTTKIDWSDGIFKRTGWDNDPVVIESHKLLFFTVPKNACTTFKKLFRRMMGHPDWFDRSPHDPAKNGLRYLGHYARDRQREFLTSPEWTRAIFVRDPLERTLSAYMDKALQTGNPHWKPPVEGAHLKQLCCSLKGADETPASRKLHLERSPPICREPPLFPYETALTADNFPFETFVEKLLRPCWDTHWRSQYERMKPANWGLIDFVGRFEDKLADTHRLLKRIGAYEEYGAAGWGESFDPETNATRSLSIFETNTALHKTGSSDAMSKHYSETVRKTVSGIFRRDYELKLFNFTDPMTDSAETAVL